MACNDYRAQQVIEACGDMGVYVPEEIAVLGVDNDEFLCNLFPPQLSSVEFDLYGAGFEMASALDKLMKGEQLTNKIINIKPIRVITRQSTDVTAIEDEDVSQSIHYINQNVYNLIQINDVVEHIGVSERNLKEKFHNTLGCSIFEMIKRSRISAIERLLLDTDMTITEIAIKMGYNDSDHISRYFKKKVGHTPLEYRTKFKFRNIPLRVGNSRQRKHNQLL